MDIINDSIIILTPVGKLDISSSIELENEINNIINIYNKYNILIDLSRVQMLTSTALRVLIDSKKILGENGLDLKLVNANEFCYRIIDMVSLSDLIPLFDSIDEAIKSFK